MDMILGGAQLGMQYGVTNTSPRLSPTEVTSLLSYALDNSIEFLDSAQAYGVSESIIGQTGISQSFKVITKFIASEHNSLDDLLEASLKNLRVSKLYGVMIHNAEDIAEKKILHRALDQLQKYQQNGLVENIGVSVYNPDTLLNIMNSVDINLVQFPSNVFDQRFFCDRVQKKLKDNNIEQHVRSIFLQGLLLLSLDQLPSEFSAYKPYFQKFTTMQQEYNLSALEFCLAYMQWTAAKWGAKIKPIVGVVSQEQLSEIIVARNKIMHLQLLNIFEDLAVEDAFLTDPRQWRKML